MKMEDWPQKGNTPMCSGMFLEVMELDAQNGLLSSAWFKRIELL